MLLVNMHKHISNIEICGNRKVKVGEVENDSLSLNYKKVNLEKP